MSESAVADTGGLEFQFSSCGSKAEEDEEELVQVYRSQYLHRYESIVVVRDSRVAMLGTHHVHR